MIISTTGKVPVSVPWALHRVTICTTHRNGQSHSCMGSNYGEVDALVAGENIGNLLVLFQLGQVHRGDGIS